MMFARARVYYAMARDGLFFQARACIQPIRRRQRRSSRRRWSGLLVSRFRQRADDLHRLAVAVAGSLSCASRAA